MGSGNRRFENDAFSQSHLPMARKYPPLSGRGRLFAAGGISAIIVAIPFLADAFFGSAGSVSRGPLSESHALFGKDCQTCHTPGESVPDAKCRVCHEKAGDPMGSYSYEKHYLYRSTEFDRSSPASQEVSCATCHVEHRGAQASLQRVSDARCQSCHDVSDFAKGHPEFDFAAEHIPDPSNLKNPHVLHVKEIVEKEELGDIEAACVKCHEPQPDGRHFQPISFDRHCDECHLTQTTATPWLPVASPNDPVKPGVLTLDAIRRDPAGIAAGAGYWDPNEFRESGGQLQKRPLYHADPWVLYNLDRLRQRLYPTAALAELLRSSADPPPGASPGILHQEAIATLRSRIQALRGEPSRDVQDELRYLEELLEVVETRLEDPYAPVDESRFDVSVADRSPDVESGAISEAAFTAVIDSLTSACQECHVVERATIKRVQKDQRTLNRAEFDHRAHFIHAQCLDCHTVIPVKDWFSAEDDPPDSLDNASIQNLPSIANCRSCHQKGGSPERCTTCHLFHPDRSHWSNLSRYRQTPK